MKVKNRIIEVLLLLLFTLPLWGKSTDFEMFFPNNVPEGTLILESPEIPSIPIIIGSYIQLEKSPVVFYDSTGKHSLKDMVYYRAQLRILGAYTFGKIGMVAVDIPGTFLSDVNYNMNKMVPHLSYLNDMIIKGRFPIVAGKEWRFGATPFISLATGNATTFGGTDARLMEPGVILLGEFSKKIFLIRFNLGYKERDDTYLKQYKLKIGDEILYKIGFTGLWYREKHIILSVELNGKSMARTIFRDKQHDALESYFTLQKRMGNFTLTGGFSVGLTKAFGVPAVRFIAGVYYYPFITKKKRLPPPAPKKVKPKPVVKKKPSVKKIVRGIVKIQVKDENNNPLQAEVMVLKNGKRFKGKTRPDGQVIFKGKPGKITFIFNKKGFYSNQITTMVEAGKTKMLMVILKKKTPEKALLNFIVKDDKGNLLNGKVFVRELSKEFPFKNGKATLKLNGGRYTFVFNCGENYFPYKLILSVNNGEKREMEIEVIKKSKKKKVILTEKEILITDKIYFKTGSYKILPKSYPILDAIAKLMKEHPEIKKLIIKGYTDNRGSSRYNLRLSRNRARAVMRYLIKKGISPSRLKAVGFGPDNPIADNKTKEGRALNRRVEFEVVR